MERLTWLLWMTVFACGALIGFGCDDDSEDSGDSETDTESDTETEEDSDTSTGIVESDDVVVVVEEALLPDIQDSLDQYFIDVETEGFAGRIVAFEGGTAQDLKDLLNDEAHTDGLGYAFLIGDLPAAWLGMRAFDEYEEFPCDHFLADLDDWGSFVPIFRRAPVNPMYEIVTSRLTGTAEEINAYFEKVHQYRTKGSLVDPSAFVFVDEDWQKEASIHDLDTLYGTVDVFDKIENTNRQDYIDQLTGDGAEFVHQQIHAKPRVITIDGPTGGTISTFNVLSHNYKASFVNLWNCSACRFTENNLGMTYTTKTDYGLAMIGTTKDGATLGPAIFYKKLAEGLTWGRAFLEWQHLEGFRNWEWHAGIVILGDPLLRISSETAAQLENLASSVEVSDESVKRMRRIMTQRKRSNNAMTFEEYKKNNPHHFIPASAY